MGDRGSAEDPTEMPAAAAAGGEADSKLDATWIQKNPLPAYAALIERLRQGNKLVQYCFCEQVTVGLAGWGIFLSLLRLAATLQTGASSRRESEADSQSNSARPTSALQRTFLLRGTAAIYQCNICYEYNLSPRYPRYR